MRVFSNGPITELRSSYRNFRCIISNGNDLYFRFTTFLEPFGIILRWFEASRKNVTIFCKNWHTETLWEVNFGDPLYSTWPLKWSFTKMIAGLQNYLYYFWNKNDRENDRSLKWSLQQVETYDLCDRWKRFKIVLFG